MEIRWLLQWLELTCTLRFRLVPEGTGSANKHEIERVHCRGALSASASGFMRLLSARTSLSRLDSFEDDDFAERRRRVKVSFNVIAQRRVTLCDHISVAGQNQIDVLGFKSIERASAFYGTDADAAPE